MGGHMVQSLEPWTGSGGGSGSVPSWSTLHPESGHTDRETMGGHMVQSLEPWTGSGGGSGSVPSWSTLHPESGHTDRETMGGHMVRSLEPRTGSGEEVVHTSGSWGVYHGDKRHGEVEVVHTSENWGVYHGDKRHGEEEVVHTLGNPRANTWTVLFCDALPRPTRPAGINRPLFSNRQDDQATNLLMTFPPPPLQLSNAVWYLTFSAMTCLISVRTLSGHPSQPCERPLCQSVPTSESWRGSALRVGDL
ncbi:hypothetical protein RRG08_024234 [Elysia crispata]|uniref:Uncharacterized protein n=1 Tax=Elysia crispata TaxID=231223 RepID=A0AAE1D2J9_9GAST|nr:hypothetical protein RRG08_024234 [Elysia crispata]